MGLRKVKECEHSVVYLGKFYTVYRSELTPIKTFVRERHICKKCKKVNDTELQHIGNTITNRDTEGEQLLLEEQLRAKGFSDYMKMVEDTKNFR